MGYPVKVQKVERPTNRSYYINFPVALAEAIDLKKGERCEWRLQDSRTLILKRFSTSATRNNRRRRISS